MDLKDIMNADAVRFSSHTSSKKRLLQEISEQAATVYGLDAGEVLEALTEREKLGSTGVGRGVAIPHARFESLDRVYGFFTRLEKPVDFDSMDRQPVDLVFTILAPSQISHNPANTHPASPVLFPRNKSRRAESTLCPTF